MFGVLVLPEAKDEPVTFVKDLIDSTVSSDVFVDLLTPPQCIRTWLGSMKRASVPVASVDEYHNAVASPHDVSTDPKIRFNAFVYAVSQSRCVQSATDIHLGLGVPAALLRHS